MSIKQYILFLTAGTSIALCAWLIVLIGINPVTAGSFGFLAFYATLFFTLVGIFTILATIMRLWRKKHPTTESIVKVSLRQGVLLAILLETSIILLSLGYLTTTTIIILVILISILEFIFLATDNKAHR